MQNSWVEVNNKLGHRFTLNAGELGGHVLKRGRVWIIQILTSAGDVFIHRNNVSNPIIGRAFAELAIALLQCGVRSKAEQTYFETVFKKFQ